MRATGRHPQALVGITRQHAAVPFSKGGRALSQIDEHIEDRSRSDPDELTLRRIATLVVQTTQHIFRRAAVIVLHEIGINSQLGEGFLVPGLQKKTTRVTKHTRPQEVGTINFCRILCHRNIRNTGVEIACRMHTG